MVYCSKKNRIIPHFLQTLPLEKLHKERKNNESNRHRSPGGRSWKNRHPERNPPHTAHPRGRPAVNIIDSKRKVCLRGWKPGKQNFFIDKLRNLQCIPKKAKYFKKGVAERDTLCSCRLCCSIGWHYCWSVFKHSSSLIFRMIKTIIFSNSQ